MPEAVATPNSHEELVTKFKALGQVALEWLEEHGRASGVPVRTELLFGGVSDLVPEQAAHAQILALGRRGHGHAEEPGSLGGQFRGR